jgi:hypothetical protein
MDGAEWLRTQLTSFGCAACGQAYEPARIRVLAEREGLFFVDLGCGHCGTQAVAIVTIQIDGGGGPEADMGDLLPLEPAELGRVAGAPVSADDVLDAHRFLEDFQGDVTTLMRVLERDDPAEVR